MKIETTTVTQTGNAVLGTEEKSLYYLIVTANEGKTFAEKLIINVGQKTHDKVKSMMEKEEQTKPVENNTQDEKPVEKIPQSLDEIGKNLTPKTK